MHSGTLNEITMHSIYQINHLTDNLICSKSCDMQLKTLFVVPHMYTTLVLPLLMNTEYIYCPTLVQLEIYYSVMNIISFIIVYEQSYIDSNKYINTYQIELVFVISDNNTLLMMSVSCSLMTVDISIIVIIITHYYVFYYYRHK